MDINRLQLEAEYRKYISEIAQGYVKTNTIDPYLKKVVNSIQAKMRDLDIVEAVKDAKQKQKTKNYQS